MTWTNPDYQDEAVYDPANPLEPDETPDPEAEPDFFSDEQIEVLNEARTILKQLAETANELAWKSERLTTQQRGYTAARPSDYGRVIEACRRTEDALFEALNTAHCYLRLMTADQVQNKETA